MEPARSSFSFNNSPRASTEEWRHVIMTQMDVLEPEAGEGSTRGTLLQWNQLSKSIMSLTHSPSLLSFPEWLPSRNYLIAKISTPIRQIGPNWATILSRSYALILVISLVYLVFFSHVFTINRRRPGSVTNLPDTIREFVRRNTNASSIREK